MPVSDTLETPGRDEQGREIHVLSCFVLDESVMAQYF
jgi:hypothetical protein